MLHPSLLPAPDADARRALIQSTDAPRDVATEPLDPLLLAEIATGLARTVPQDGADRRLLATNRYEAWVVAFPPGCTWHLDGDGAGAIHVVAGELLELWTGERDHAPTPRTVGAGDTIGVGWTGNRRVVNTTSRPAVVVHVSSPPSPPVVRRACHDLPLAG